MRGAAPKDARIRELEFLSRVEREKSVSASIHNGILNDELLKQMIVHLIHEGYLNGVDNFPRPGLEGLRRRGIGAESREEVDDWHWSDIRLVLNEQQVHLELSHKGRVRISELRDELRGGKLRDPSGLLWSVRHLERDLVVAVLEASEATPVSVALLDMNGLKDINDKRGHDAGTAMIGAYLQVIAMFAGDGIDAYRGDSSDEVYLILRATPPDQARKTLCQVLTRLGQERVTFEGSVLAPHLTACCGITSTTDPSASAEELRRQADDRLLAAKTTSKSQPKRPSVLLDASGEQVLPLA